MQPLLLSTSVRYFMAVAESGSLSAAALRLHVAVSAVSRQVAKLEDLFGCALFERHTRGMEPTDAGQRLVVFARRVQLDADRVIEEVRGVALDGPGVVRVGCVEGLSSGFMPEVMASFRKQFPATAVHLKVAAPDEVSHLLRQGEVEVALKYCVAPEAGLQSVHQQHSPVVALVAPEHLLARRRTVDARELVRHALAVPPAGHTVRTAFDLCCSQHGLQYTPAFTGNAASTMALAAQGHAVMLGGQLGSEHLVREGQLRAVRVVEEAMQARTMHVLVLQDRSLPRRAAAFVDHLVAAIERAGRPRAARGVATGAKTTRPTSRAAHRKSMR